MTEPSPLVQDRRADDIAAELLARLPLYHAAWKPGATGPTQAMVRIFANYLQSLGAEIDSAAEKQKLAFFDFLGVEQLPAQAARAPVVFTAIQQAGDTQIPEGTRVAASIAGASEPIVFETEQTIVLAKANIVQVAAVFPDRDVWSDHSSVLAGGNPFRPSDTPTPIEHAIYIAHDPYLALSGAVTVELNLQVYPPVGSVVIAWEYWDGGSWEPLYKVADNTGGMSRNGTIRLTANAARSARRTINGVESYWIRGQCSGNLEPYLPHTAPEFRIIGIGTWNTALDTGGESILGMGNGIRVGIDQALRSDATVMLSGPVNESKTAKAGAAASWNIAQPGTYTLSVSLPEYPSAYTSTITFGGASTAQVGVTIAPHYQPSAADPPLLLFAFLGSSPLDLSGAILPFGTQAQAGASLELGLADTARRGGTTLKFTAADGNSSDDAAKHNASNAVQHMVAAEYWDGTRWQTLPITGMATTLDASIDRGGEICFSIDSDLRLTTLHDQVAGWVRFRIVSGSYSYKRTLNDPARTVIIEPGPPALVGLAAQYAYVAPQALFACNDFTWTDLLKTPSQQPFTASPGPGQSLYAGFDGSLPAGLVSLYFDLDVGEILAADIIQQPVPVMARDVVWESWNGTTGRELIVEDDTLGLASPGVVSFDWPTSPALARFGTPCFWVRARATTDQGLPNIAVKGIYLNAVWALQRQTYQNEVLGSSDGQPDQVLFFPRGQILPGERMEVRELSGREAAVAWPMLSAELLEQGFDESDFRTVTDARTGQLSEVWIRWRARPNFFFSGPNDHHYVIQHEQGRVYFGDGILGLCPSPGTGNICGASYRAGGGVGGNVAAGTITQLLSGVLAQGVTNPHAAEGGADAEPFDAVERRGAALCRNRQQAIAREEFEALACAASPAVAAAWAYDRKGHYSGTMGGGTYYPPLILVIIVPRCADPRPMPSLELCRQVCDFIAPRMPALATESLAVFGPTYVPAAVRAVIAPKDPAAGAAVIEDCRAALTSFLHPLTGGPDGTGWPFGRALHLSDVASVVGSVANVDFVTQLTLIDPRGALTDTIEVPPGDLLAAGSLELSLATKGS